MCKCVWCKKFPFIATLGMLIFALICQCVFIVYICIQACKHRENQTPQSINKMWSESVRKWILRFVPASHQISIAFVVWFEEARVIVCHWRFDRELLFCWIQMFRSELCRRFPITDFCLSLFTPGFFRILKETLKTMWHCIITVFFNR